MCRLAVTEDGRASYGEAMRTMQQLARRWYNTLQLTEVNDPTPLMTPNDGAVIVYLPPPLAGQEVQLADEHLDWRTEPKNRVLRGRPFTCAIFHWVRPGRYVLRCRPAARETEVEVAATQLVQVDWRNAPPPEQQRRARRRPARTDADE